MKKYNKIILALGLSCLGMSSYIVNAEEKKEQVFVIKVDKSDNKDPVVDLKIDNTSESFNMPELVLGESKTITSNSGKNITLTKTEKGVNVEVDGEVLELPSFDGDLGAKIHRSSRLHNKLANTVQISGIELNDSQKQIIRDAFIAAGIEKEVSFNNHNIMLFSSDNNINFIPGKHKKIWKSDGNPQVQVIVKKDQKNKDIHIEEETIIIEQK
ncbi:hypothetical protein [Aliikangiella sp. IMCC44359]|uniref:hypothetical protein n=1 Tax=Aliikangiella sp. IMCC44359 TaxID=3459125 RepID=UPI00403A8994